MATIDHNKLTVAAATVAAELHHAERIAKQLTISAKNAAAIVLRAGSQAAGLSVISSFYDELANKTITLARVINSTAVQLSAVTVLKWRSSAVVENIRRAYEMAEGTPRRDELLPLIEKMDDQLVTISREFDRLLKTLNENLREVQQHMRAIDVIAVTSRLEAQKTGDFKEGLMQMAHNIQTQANTIKSHVSHSIQLLNI